MKYFLIVIVLLIIIAVINVILLYEKGSLGFVHPLKTARKSDVKVACVGDSITYGYSIKHWSKNNYPTVLQQLCGKGYCVNNYGHSGRTVQKEGDFPYVNEKLYHKSLSFHPDVVVLMLGTNDTKAANWCSKERFLEDYKELVLSYQNLPSAPCVYLMSPPPAFSVNGSKVNFGINPCVIKELRQYIQKFADNNHLHYIDIYSVFDDNPELFSDGVHLNAKGTVLLAETVYGYIMS